MKYTKPKRLAAGFSDLDYSAIFAFLDSLPDEFEIVEPGMTQVRWPEGVTRNELLGWGADLERYLPEGADILRYIARLAAIAPEEKKKRKVELWRHESWPSSMPPHAQISGASMFSDGVGGWRKVGECEVTE